MIITVISWFSKIFISVPLIYQGIGYSKDRISYSLGVYRFFCGFILPEYRRKLEDALVQQA